VIKQILSIQVKNETAISTITENPILLNELMLYPMQPTCPELAFAMESGTVYIFFQTAKFPYEEATEFFLRAYRYPNELLDLDSTLDISPGDLELFISLSIAIAAEMQGKLIPQRILDKIDYLKSVINLEKE
jgi:hypothetical protein